MFYVKFWKKFSITGNYKHQTENDAVGYSGITLPLGLILELNSASVKNWA